MVLTAVSRIKLAILSISRNNPETDYQTNYLSATLTETAFRQLPSQRLTTVASRMTRSKQSAVKYCR